VGVIVADRVYRDGLGGDRTDGGADRGRVEMRRKKREPPVVDGLVSTVDAWAPVG
jgi:hypothetical protein